ncbi:MAG: hypothetical protein J1F28_10780 [Oscillospiraceae bacterium]|nr:hypothetical protein [Oscillospiraceae bacterium]
MIEILQNKENLDKIEFNARDGAEELGKIAGELKGDVFVINELLCDDLMADGLVRAILNLMSLHGIDRARFELSEKNELLKKLGFFNDKPEIESISAFFYGKCCK